ncbi:MAG: hypothetical protein ABIZ04_13905 [Opitutus sp.]
METPPSLARTFPVAYQTFSGPSNPDLRGTGLLTVNAIEPRFCFSGETRRLFGHATVGGFRDA